jgi:hypothetical protein
MRCRYPPNSIGFILAGLKPLGSETASSIGQSLSKENYGSNDSNRATNWNAANAEGARAAAASFVGERLGLAGGSGDHWRGNVLLLAQDPSLLFHSRARRYHGKR